MLFRSCVDVRIKLPAAVPSSLPESLQSALAALLDPTAAGLHAALCPGCTLITLGGVEAPARQCKLSTSTEPLHLVEDSNGRPADTCVESGHGLGDDIKVCYDVVGCGAATQAYVEHAARYTGGAWQKAVEKKLRKASKINANDKELLVVPMAFDSQGGLHPNWRITYNMWAERWASLGEGRDKAAQAALVRGWVARTSVAIQRGQCRLVRATREGAVELHYHGAEPHAHRMPDVDDIGGRHARGPPGLG